MMLTLTLLCLATPPPQNAERRTGPFTAVRWENEVPVVQVDGEWYTFVSIDGHGRDKIVAFLKKEYERNWKEAFGEDLVEAFEKMGPKLQVEVKLVLEKDGRTVERTGTMTKEARRAARTYNNEHPEEVKVERPDRPRPSRPRVDRGILFDFSSAKIVFVYSGDFEGTETLYAAEQGKIMVLVRNKKVGAWNRLTTVWKDGKVLTINHEKKTGFSFGAIKPVDMNLSVRHANDRTLARLGFVRMEGTEEIAGKPCVLYEKTKGDSVLRSWRWKGIELKIETRNVAGGSYTKVATSVEESITIPEELLRIPEGYSNAMKKK